MADEDTTTEPGAEAQAALDEAQGKGRSSGAPKKRTRYVVLWAKVPAEDDDRPPAYREIGRYAAHSGQDARRQAVNDEQSGVHAQLQDAAKDEGVLLRSSPEGSWGGPDAEAERVRVEMTPQLIVP